MKTILITGGSRGIGRETALLCAKRGWSVGINYVGNQHAAEDTAEMVRAAGGRAITVKGDVAGEGHVIAMFERTERELGRISGVVLNAGIVAPGLPLAEMSLERLRRVFDVNVLGAY